MSDKKAIVFGVISLILALAYTAATNNNFYEVRAIFITIFILGVFVPVTNILFVKIRSLHSKVIYYVTMTLVLGLVFFVFALLLPDVLLSDWQAKVIISVIASLSITLPLALFFDKILGLTIVPWGKKK